MRLNDEDLKTLKKLKEGSTWNALKSIKVINDKIKFLDIYDKKISKNCRDYFKKDVCNGVLGQTYEYFTKSTIKKADLENMTSAEQTKAEQNKVYKVGSLKGRTFLNFCKIGYFLKDTDGLYRAEPNKNGQLLIKMSAVKKLKAEKNQSFWDSKIDNTDYALFSYNDCIRAYLTLFGVSRENQNDKSKAFSYNDCIRAYLTMFGLKRESGNDKSKAFNLMQDLINLVNETDIEKFMSVNYDIFVADELNNNESKISQLINLLTNVMSERAEQHTKGQGNKNKYDVISEKLFVEYKQIKNNVETYEPIKKAS